MIRLLLLAALTGLTLNLPLPDAKIYFPDEKIPVDGRSGFPELSGKPEQRTYYTKSSFRKGGGFQSPMQWPPAAGETHHSYGSPAVHHLSYSSYGHRPQHHPAPHRLSYSSHSYGSEGSHHQSHPHLQSLSYGGSQSHSFSGGSVDGQIEQMSHGGSYGSGLSHGAIGGSVDGQIEQMSHGGSYGSGQSHGAIGGSVEGQIEQMSHGGSYGSGLSHGASGGSVDGQIEQMSHGGSYGSGQSHGAIGGSVEGQIEQMSHGGSYGSGQSHGATGGSVEGQIEQMSNGGSYGSSQSHSASGGSLEGQIEQMSHGGSYGSGLSHGATGGSVEGQIEQMSHGGSYGSSQSHSISGGSVEGQIEQMSHGGSYGGSHSHGSTGVSQSHGFSGGSVEGEIEHVSHGTGSSSLDGSRYEVDQLHETGNENHPPEIVETVHGSQHKASTGEQQVVDGAAEPSYGQHTIESGGQVNDVKKPTAAEVAAEEHHIIQEIEHLVGLTSSPEASTKNPITLQQEIIREINGLSDPNHTEDTKRTEEAEEKQREVEEPKVKVTLDHGYQGAGRHVVHTHVEETSSHKKSTPDPLDLLNLYNDYVQGDFKPGHPKLPPVEPKKEVKPEIKQAIENIMRDWEVLPEQEGKPAPPQRKYKITKHVKVTTTTHNHPVVVQPSQTITKTVQTHTYQPTHHHQITHHINIVDLLEQLRQLESSPHHRNVTWCEEKIKEFLTELNRKEESGIEINQSVQEETLHHILTQDHTITKEVHHEVGHDASNAVEEAPFVKKTVVELGLNEPTKPPSYWTEQETKHETNSITSNGSAEEEQKGEEPGEVPYETSKETKRDHEPEIITVTPSPDHVKPLEALSHQSHTSQENENPPAGESEGNMDQEGSEPVGVTATPEHKNEIEEFRGETERQDRPLPAGYKPHERSEEEKEMENGSGNIEEKKEEHKRIDDLSIELPQNEVGEEAEHKSGENLNERDENSSRQEQEHVIHELNTGEDSVGKTEYVVESEHQNGRDETEEHHSEGEEGHSPVMSNTTVDVGQGHFGEASQTEFVEETVENTGGHHGHPEGGMNTIVEGTVYNNSVDVGQGHFGEGSQTEFVEETVENTGGHHGHPEGGVNTIVEGTVYNNSVDVGQGHFGEGSQTEFVEETVENTGGHHGHPEGGVNTIVEETVHHSSGGGSYGGGGQTQYVEETVEHHNSGGSNEINYDQLIEELISLESLPGHQAIDKCEEKIRHFLEVLRRQQERGFDQNKAELQRLRLLLEEIQKQKHSQPDHGINPHNPEEPHSFWKKIGRKIKTTYEKAKTKAHDTVNGIMN